MNKASNNLRNSLEQLHVAINALPESEEAVRKPTAETILIVKSIMKFLPGHVEEILKGLEFTDITNQIENAVIDLYRFSESQANKHSGMPTESMYLRHRDAFKKVLDKIEELKIKALKND